MASPLEDFLQRNSIQNVDGSVPLVHSTKSFNIRELIKKSGLDPSFCKEYKEDLLYFFLGRPAYRWNRPDGTPEEWELPTCFVFDKIEKMNVKRVIPFDSGAYKAEIYPTYIQNIPLENFESTDEDAPNRIVSAFFGSFSDYVAYKPKDRSAMIDEFSLGPLDAEVLAFSALANDKSASKVDDRRFSIEIQSSSSINFTVNPPSAVILPTPYLKEAKVRDKLDEWGSEIISYNTYGLSLQSYFAAIFIKFTEYCERKGML